MKILASPISCPPAILKEKQLLEAAEGCNLAKWIPESHTRTPTEGPPVKYMYHGREEHSEGDPQDCQACAKEVIRYLQTLFTGMQHGFFSAPFYYQEIALKIREVPAEFLPSFRDIMAHYNCQMFINLSDVY